MAQVSDVDEKQRREFVEGLKTVAMNAYLHGGMDALDWVNECCVLYAQIPGLSDETIAMLTAQREHLEKRKLEMQLQMREEPSG